MPYSKDLKISLIELESDSSVQPELHQKLRTQNFEGVDWRKKFAELREAKPVQITNERSSQELVACLRALSGKSLIVSVAMIKAGDESLLRLLMNFLQTQGSLLSAPLSCATACAVRFHHGEIRLDLKISDEFSSELLGQKLDIEIQQPGSMLSSYDYTRSHDWLILSMNLLTKETDSFEEISR